MNGNITPLLTGAIENGSSLNRWTSTSANLSVNGFLFDVKFTVPASYTGKWDFTKDIFINITKRIGSGNSGAVALLSNVRLYDALAYSDFKAGVSMSSTTFTQGEEVRVSGYLPTGYFGMTSRDALEVTMNISDKTNFPASDVLFEISSVFDKIQATEYKCYQSTGATGADQPYKNVVEIAYIGSGVNADFVVNDQIGNKNVNINSAIALSNATGEFEFFTDLGIVYQEQFGIGQDLACRCPNTTSPSLLVVSYSFYPEETVNNVEEVKTIRDSLIENIKNNDPDKYKYLLAIGAI